MASAVASKVDAKPAPPSAGGKTVAPAVRLVSTGGAPPRSSSDGVKDSTGKGPAADRRRERAAPIPTLFTAPDVLDEFPQAALQDLLLALAKDGGSASLTRLSPRGGRVSKEDGEAVHLKLPMPGLGKEHVKMHVEKDVLVIKGEGDKDSEGDGDKVPAHYTYRVGLNSQAFKMDKIKAEMKNGVLMVTLPKLKNEERKDVFEITIE